MSSEILRWAANDFASLQQMKDVKVRRDGPDWKTLGNFSLGRCRIVMACGFLYHCWSHPASEAPVSVRCSGWNFRRIRVSGMTKTSSENPDSVALSRSG
jgi:hypothetical protein